MLIWRLTVYAYEPGFEFPPVTHVFSGQTQEAACDTYHRHLACDPMLFQRTCEGLTDQEWDSYECSPYAEPVCPPEQPMPSPMPPPGMPPNIPVPPDLTPTPPGTPPGIPPRFTPTTPLDPGRPTGNGLHLEQYEPPQRPYRGAPPGLRAPEVPRSAPLDPRLAAQLAPWLQRLQQQPR
jgi:hypothetical protein